MANEGFDSWAKCVFCSSFCFPMLFIKMWTLLGKALKAYLPIFSCSWTCFCEKPVPGSALWSQLPHPCPYPRSWYCPMSSPKQPVFQTFPTTLLFSVCNVSFFSLSWRISLSLYSSLNNLWCIVFVTDSSQGNQETYLLRASGTSQTPKDLPCLQASWIQAVSLLQWPAIHSNLGFFTPQD